MTLDDLKANISELLCLEDYTVVDLICCAYISHFMDGDPVWLMIVGAPASGKTELLSGLKWSKGIFPLSSLTPNTLISGWSKEGQGPAKNIKNESLLFKLRNKILIMKDFTSVLQMRPDSRNEIMGQLREVYDGAFTKGFGTKQEVHWNGRVGLIAGVTPAIYKHTSFFGQMGERFIYYEMPERDEFEAAMRAIRVASGSNGIRKTIQRAFKDFTDGLRHRGPVEYQFGEKEEMALAYLALISSTARTVVYRDIRHQIEMKPMVEGPGRLGKQFEGLYRAGCLVYDTDRLEGPIYDLIKKVAFMSIPGHRRMILDALWKGKMEGLKVSMYNQEETVYPARTAALARLLNLPESLIRYNLEDLQLVGLLGRDKENQNLWLFTERGERILCHTGTWA